MKLHAEGYNFDDATGDPGQGPSRWAVPLMNDINTHISQHFLDKPSSPLDSDAPRNTRCAVQGTPGFYHTAGVGTCWRIALQNTRAIYNQTNVQGKRKGVGLHATTLGGAQGILREGAIRPQPWDPANNTNNLTRENGLH
eukprot:13499750-Heterocapsa_arctica.AAC.1